MKQTILKSSRFHDSGRLDAKYYLSPGLMAANAIKEFKENGGKCISLGGESGIANIPRLNRFKSAYAAENEPKFPYLRPYDVFSYLPTATRFLSIPRTKNIDSYRLKPGVILQTCSGRNLGPLTIVDEYLSQFVVSSDMLRIEIDDEKLRFYLLTFLKTEIGQNLLKRGKTGSVIDHLSPSHVESLDVPLLSDDKIYRISELMKTAFSLREQARLVLSKEISEFSDSLPSYQRLKPLKNGWEITALDLFDRLDAAYYDPRH